MAKLNFKDSDESLFPAKDFHILIRNEGRGNQTPHVHVVNKKERYNVRILIENGELLEVIKSGKRSETDKFEDVVENIKKWFDLPSMVPMAKGDTNKQFAMGIWELSNP